MSCENEYRDDLRAHRCVSYETGYKFLLSDVLQHSNDGAMLLSLVTNARPVR